MKAQGHREKEERVVGKETEEGRGGMVPLEEFRRLYAEMKKWKEKYRETLGKDDLIKEKEREIERLKGALYDLQVKRALVDAAVANYAVDAEQVAFLVARYVQLDENFQPVVVDDEGKRRFTKSGAPMSVDGLVKEFMWKYPHHRKPFVERGGAGTVVSIGSEEGKTLGERVQSAKSFRELERIVAQEAGLKKRV
ncbi:MAG: hypothetical protein N2234_00200 [Planctomycetota bacterium]|nr:hypothetical protein [Planctomycetota bacterium]